MSYPKPGSAFLAAGRFISWATARLNQIPLIYSEDFKSNTIIEGIRFMNPLMQS